jgi:hypothetical protein
MYHATESPRLVKSAAEFSSLGPGWSEQMVAPPEPETEAAAPLDQLLEEILARLQEYGLRLDALEAAKKRK